MYQHFIVECGDSGWHDKGAGNQRSPSVSQEIERSPFQTSECWRWCRGSNHHIGRRTIPRDCVVLIPGVYIGVEIRRSPYQCPCQSLIHGFVSADLQVAAWCATSPTLTQKQVVCATERESFIAVGRVAEIPTVAEIRDGDRIRH